MSDTIHTSTLSNGLTVVTQTTPGARSAALGLWLVNGGRHQGPGQSGYAHLLEHLLFKGTATLDAHALSRRFDAMGGQVNAHTGRELTALHGQVAAARLGELAGLFADMLIAPRFNEDDVALEREVVIQEMAMVEESPEEALEEFGVRCVWPGHAIGWSILGDAETVRGATAAGMQTYVTGLRQGRRLWVAAAGAVDHAELVQACAPLAALPAGLPALDHAPRFAAGRYVRKRKMAQQHLLWLLPVPAPADPQYAARLIANHMLGGGLSSVLFQELRERRGLVYGIDSHLDLYSDGGLWLVQTSCEPEQAAQCRAAVEACIEEFIRTGPAEEALQEAREHLAASLLIEEDSPEASMERLARESIYLGRVPRLEERLARLGHVTAREVREVVAQAWAQRAEAMLGPLGE